MGALLFVRGIDQYILNTAVKKTAEVIQGDGGNRLVVLQSIQKTAADMITLDQLICSYPFFLHGFVEGLVRNHTITSTTVYGVL